jgi:hypothetical protein
MQDSVAIPFEELELASIAGRDCVDKLADPTPEMLTDPLFKVIFNAIKTWDVAIPGECISEATGNHARAIYDALMELSLEWPWVMETSWHCPIGGEPCIVSKVAYHRHIPVGVLSEPTLHYQYPHKPT